LYLPKQSSYKVSGGLTVTFETLNPPEVLLPEMRITFELGSSLYS
jgi:hypothetical protein